MLTTPDFAIAVTAGNRASMDRQLDDAVTAAKARAIRQGRQGILVTRHDYDSFTVALSDAVPYGLIREHQDW